MDIHQHRATQSAPASGLRRDVQRLREDGAASATELREFFGRMRGKTPAEALGVIAHSRLAVSMLLATAGWVLLLVTFTLLPYWLPSWFSFGSDDEAPPAAAATAKATPPAAAKKSPAAGPAKTTASKTQRSADYQGINKKKTGNPDIDNLIDK